MGSNSRSSPLPGAKRVHGQAIITEEDWLAIERRLNLTRRQFQVVQHLFDDESEVQIGLRLGISPHTVHTYIKQIYARLDVNTRSEMLIRVFAAVLAQREEQEAAQR